ncbi:unnamed protein product [Strongylus vulgaris]|uniref:BTB domain-containing protein n=1 Tax=Strongylus vulgaris TaxID=40348 RepID=A0A3P7IYC5_STRVU|nr:unnamed protein product [Strongylus vulgaris]
MSLQTDNFLGNFGFNFDFDACINVRSSKEGNDIDEPVLAHQLVLSSASARFRNLLAAEQQQESPMAKIDIDLREIPNSINAFKAMLSGLYTGELNFALADQSEILAVARHCEVPTIESKLLAANQEPAPFAALLPNKFPTITPNPPPWQTYLHTLLALYMQPGLLASTFGGAMLPCQTASLLQPSTTPVDDNRASADESSSPRTTPTAYNEKIVPNDDKEGSLCSFLVVKLLGWMDVCMRVAP